MKILNDNKINGKIIVLDGSGFTDDYVDKYYVIIRRKQLKLCKKPYFNWCGIKINTSFYSSKRSKI